MFADRVQLDAAGIIDTTGEGEHDEAVAVDSLFGGNNLIQEKQIII